MTTSTWHKSDLDRDFASCPTLKDVIVSLENRLSVKGEVICEIRINGFVLNEDDEMKYAESTLAEIEMLEVHSNRPDDLIHSAIESVIDLIPNLERVSLETATYYRSGEMGAAQSSFTQVVDGCQWLVETLIHIRGAASGLKQPIAMAEKWYSAEALITKCISELTEAYAANDTVLTADLLEYELTGALSIWKEVIESERGRR